jgi:hypothetical protein
MFPTRLPDIPSNMKRGVVREASGQPRPGPGRMPSRFSADTDRTVFCSRAARSGVARHLM